MAKEKGESFSSSAGLMRYFDSEDDKGLKISPKVIAGIAIAFTVLVLVLPVFFPVNRAGGTENLCAPERVAPFRLPRTTLSSGLPSNLVLGRDLILRRVLLTVGSGQQRRGDDRGGYGHQDYHGVQLR